MADVDADLRRVMRMGEMRGAAGAGVLAMLAVEAMMTGVVRIARATTEVVVIPGVLQRATPIAVTQALFLQAVIRGSSQGL